MFASKTADLKANDELRNCSFAAKTTDLKANDELRTDIFVSKMADLNLTPERLNLVKSHFGVENGRSELKPGAPKSRENRILASKMTRSELKSGAPKSREIAFLRRKWQVST